MMSVRRLAWAGLEISVDGERLVVDLVEDFPSLHGDSPPVDEIPASPEPAGARAALLTHLHSDHADARAVTRALRPDGIVLRPPPVAGGADELALVAEPEAAFAESGLDARVLDAWTSFVTGPFEVVALPAVDGFGDPQVSWVIAGSGQKVLHAGDTLFHGWWWLVALRHGPIDMAFLPAGGAVADLPPRQPPSPLPAGMGPREAAVAAMLVGARELVPMHYGPLHQADNYVQVADAPGMTLAEARELGVTARVMTPGEVVTLG